MVEESMVKFLTGQGWLLHNTPFSLQKISQTATPTVITGRRSVYFADLHYPSQYPL